MQTAIKRAHIVTTAMLRSLPERMQNSEIQIADGFHLAALEEAKYEPVMLFILSGRGVADLDP